MWVRYAIDLFSLTGINFDGVVSILRYSSSFQSALAFVNAVLMLNM